MNKYVFFLKNSMSVSVKLNYNENIYIYMKISHFVHKCPNFLIQKRQKMNVT